MTDDTGPVIIIHLFGKPRLIHATTGRVLYPPRSALRLFSYLLLKGKNRPLSPSVIVGDLWGNREEEKARSCLSTTLWRLKDFLESAFGKPGPPILNTRRDEISIEPGGHIRLDVTKYEQSLSRLIGKDAGILDISDIRDIESTLSIYTGDLLEGFFDDWAIFERERLQRLHIQALSHLFEWQVAKGNADQAIERGMEILKIDPYREEIQRRIIGLHLEAGEKGPALRILERLCEETQEEETGMTAAGIRKILSALLDRTEPDGAEETLPCGQGAPQDIDEAVRQIAKALSILENTQERLLEVKNALGNLKKGGDGQDAKGLSGRIRLKKR